MEMDFVWVGLLDRWGLFRFDILRGLLSGDWGPTYRRDWPGDMWGTRREAPEKG